MKKQYFVDANGNVRDTLHPPKGFRFEFHKKENHNEVWVINNWDGYIFEEYQLWNTLEDMELAGIDTSKYI